MRSAIVTGSTAVGFALFGWTMPLVFPKVPADMAKGCLAVALTLLVVALILWALDRRSEPDKGTAPITQNHSGHGHNIVADSVHFTPPQFELTDAHMEQVAAGLRPGEQVLVGWSNSRRSPDMGERLKAFLVAKGFEIGVTMEGGDSMMDPETPLTVFPNGLRPPGMVIANGMQAVYVDASINPYNESGS